MRLRARRLLAIIVVLIGLAMMALTVWGAVGYYTDPNVGAINAHCNDSPTTTMPTRVYDTGDTTTADMVLYSCGYVDVNWWPWALIWSIPQLAALVIIGSWVRSWRRRRTIATA